MRLNTVKGRRSQAWWAVFMCACLAMAVYIAFELLDLDGSELRDPPLGSRTSVRART